MKLRSTAEEYGSCVRKQLEYDDAYGGEDGKRERTQVIKLDVRTLLSNVTFGRESFTIRGKAGELLPSFSLAYDKHLGKAFPFDTPIIFAQGIANIEPELKAHGYYLIVGEDGHNKQKVYRFQWIPFEEAA